MARNDDDALLFFTYALQIQNLYDPRIQRECLLQVRALLAERYLSVSKIDIKLHNYRRKVRDIVLLVDHSDLESLALQEQAMTRIFDKHLTEHDRVCLIKFGMEPYTQTIFSLVQRNVNLAQLRN